MISSITFDAHLLEHIAFRSISFTAGVPSARVFLKYQLTRSQTVLVSVYLFIHFASGSPMPRLCLVNFGAEELFCRKSTSMNSFKSRFSFPIYCDGRIGGKGGRLGFDYLENIESATDYLSLPRVYIQLSVSSVESS